MKHTRLGDILVRAKHITPDQLEEARREMRMQGHALTAQLVKMGLFSEGDLAGVIAKAFGRPLIDLEKLELPKDLAKLSIEVLRKNAVLPVQRKGNVLTLAVADPYDINGLDEIAFISGCQVDVVIARETQLQARLEALSESDDRLEEAILDLGINELEVVETTEEPTDEHTLTEETEAAPVVKLVNLILIDAIKRGASDIHMEPYEKTLRVRYRIDGVLHEIMRPPLSMKESIVSRVKIMAHLDIAERRLPQDGRIKLRLSKAKTVDFRVSVLPTLFGEKVVMRLLDPSNLMLDMAMLGYDPQELEWFKHAIHQPYGMVLVTGPTGSGKTVSLYSAVAELNQPGINICTAEDPVEFNFMGINQVNVRSEIGLDFPAALRSFLRQDPDIILVGEIRDPDTAAIAIKAALTGHLVLATLHTNDAPSAMVRLTNMGIESFLVGSAVNLVTAQRLARKNCKSCAQPVAVPSQALIDAGVPAAEVEGYTVMQGKGCSECNGTGYKGRTGIYQVMPVFEEVREAVYSGKNTDEVNDIAVSMGVKTLRMTALEKVKGGEISLEECLRVTVAD